MKKSKWLIPVIVLGVILVLMVACFIFMAIQGLGFSTGRYLEADNGSHIVVVNNSPTVMLNRTNRDIFKNLETGDKILVVHGATEESYPGRTGAYAIFKLGSGSISDIPQTVIDSLTELGWLKSEEENITGEDKIPDNSSETPVTNEIEHTHDWRYVSENNDCWSTNILYACSICNMEQSTHGDSALPYHRWSEKTAEGKTTFSCTRCNESYTFISEIRDFSYAQALEHYKVGDPGVKHEHFNNWNIESEITGAIDVIIRAEFELTIEYDTISVSYDETSNMWRVDFWTLDLDGNSQSVYVNGNGLTCYIVYGE